MGILQFTVQSAGAQDALSFAPLRMVNAGYVGRNQEEVRRHIEELKKLGVPGPASTPTLYPLSTRILVQDDGIEVFGEETSGEAEFALLVAGDDEIYVAAGSDHTDRRLETVGIAVSKNMCPNVISRTVWRLGDVAGHWDRIILRGWVTKNGERALYQEAPLSAILAPAELLRFVAGNVEGPLRDTVVFSGTIGTVGGQLVFGDRFEVELEDPVRKAAIGLAYDVRPLRYMKRLFE